MKADKYLKKGISYEDQGVNDVVKKCRRHEASKWKEAKLMLKKWLAEDRTVGTGPVKMPVLTNELAMLLVFGRRMRGSVTQ